MMAVGMTTVFSFLVVLVGAMHVVRIVVARFAPDAPIEPPQTNDDEAIAVVLAAIARSRS